MNTTSLALSYVRDRWINSLTTIITLALGVGAIFVLLTFARQTEQHLNHDSRGIDAVVGAKGSPLQLVLSSVYHADVPPGNIRLETAGRIQAHPLVRTAVPLALGDSYKGYRIVGTESGLLDLYHATIQHGALWQAPMEVVLGNSVAREAGLAIGANIVGSHGLVSGGEEHTAFPYRVTGILAPTGTALDRLVLTSVDSVWQLHETGNHAEGDAESPDVHHDTEAGHGLHDEPSAAAASQQPSPTSQLPVADGAAVADVSVKRGDGLEAVESEPLAPVKAEESPASPDKERELTALLISYNSPTAHFTFPRWVNQHTEAQAASPSVEATRLFHLMGIGLDTIKAFALILVAVSLLSIFAALYSSLQQRRYDLAVLRALGAPPRRLLSLVLLESFLLTVGGLVLGFLLALLVLRWLPHLDDRLLFLSGWSMLSTWDAAALAVATLLAGLLAAMIPARLAYRTNVAATLALR
jgi:putative ABC transport system permease protein